MASVWRQMQVMVAQRRFETKASIHLHCTLSIDPVILVSPPLSTSNTKFRLRQQLANAPALAAIWPPWLK
jgi:hypothetical protein